MLDNDLKKTTQWVLDGIVAWVNDEIFRFAIDWCSNWWEESLSGADDDDDDDEYLLIVSKYQLEVPC